MAYVTIKHKPSVVNTQGHSPPLPANARPAQRRRRRLRAAAEAGPRPPLGELWARAARREPFNEGLQSADSFLPVACSQRYTPMRTCAHAVPRPTIDRARKCLTDAN